MATIQWKDQTVQEQEDTVLEEETLFEEALKNTQLDYMIDLDFRLSMIELGL